MNSSLFPNADPDSFTRAEPPPEIVTIQSLLHASLATPLLAAFLAMLRKHWVDRYVRNRGRELDGLEKWYSNLVTKSVSAISASSGLPSRCSVPPCPGIYGRPAALSLGSPLL